MIADTIISDDVWAGAPEDPTRAFLFIAEAAYERLKYLRTNEEAQQPHSYADWRRQYVFELATVAEQLGIQGLMTPDEAVQSGGHMNLFDISLARTLTRIKASLRAELRSDSVALSFHTKNDIRVHLEELRTKVNNSNLSDDLRAALHKRIDAVEAELDKARSNITTFWKLAGAITLASTLVATAADLPDAIETTQQLVQLVHEDKAAEEASKHRLIPPQLSAKNVRQITNQSAEGKKAKGKDS